MELARRIHAERRLRAKDLPALNPGTHEDGGGLRLVVEPSGSRRWVLRVTIAGKRHNRGLGPYPLIPLDTARDKALDIRRAAREGRDLAAEERQTRPKTVAFREAFEIVFELRRQKLSNAKHIWQWKAQMEAHAYPHIGDRPVSDITHAEILAVLQPIWFEKSETARRLLQRMELVFRSAILRGQRTSASPCVGVAEELGVRTRDVEHHRALPHGEVPAFLEALRTCNSEPVTKLAFEWLVLTATRSGETRGATWSEIDEAQALWTIPRQRMMKGRREHLVPLSDRCMAILKETRALTPKSLMVFPSPNRGEALSDMVFMKVLRDNGLADRATAHGFRSSFRDWATEVDKVREVVAEAALAHAVRNKTEAAYRRAAYLTERVGLMERWARYCERAIWSERVARESCSARSRRD